jgi:hypothetical protein
MAGGGDNAQTNGAHEQSAMEEGRKEEYDQGCGLAVSIPFVQKVSLADGFLVSQFLSAGKCLPEMTDLSLIFIWLALNALKTF